MVSPLMRALETAVGCLGGDGLADASPTSAVPPLMLATEAVDEVRPGHAAVGPYMGAVRAPLAFVACELCREHIGKNPCDRRRPTSEYRAMFPGVDFSCITEEEDVLWGKGLGPSYIRHHTFRLLPAVLSHRLTPSHVCFLPPSSPNPRLHELSRTCFLTRRSCTEAELTRCRDWSVGP